VRARVGFLVVSLVLVAVLVSFASGASELVGKGLVRLVGMFGQVVALVRTNYVEDVPVDRLEVGAMTGLVEAADPGGSWVPDSGEAAFAEVRGRDVPAYGLVLGKRASYPVVLEVLPASAAEKAGLRAGEMIERIGDEPVRARPLWRTRVILDEAAKRGGTVTLDVIDRQFSATRPRPSSRRPWRRWAHTRRSSWTPADWRSATTRRCPRSRPSWPGATFP
jgi:S1-C subfamily serine protease